MKLDPQQLDPICAAIVILMAAVLLGACDQGNRPARVSYNDGLAAYRDSKWDEAAQKFLDARQNAGQDHELRFRAAYNLGLAHARKADSLTQENPQEAMEGLRQSAAWLRDAVSLMPRHEQSRVDLEVVLHRIQILADQLNKGQNRLETRLDRVIENQRGLRDELRSLMTQVSEAGNAAEPVAFQAEFERLATIERTLLADVGTISDLAGDELGLLESKARSGQAGQGQGPGQGGLGQEEQVRMAQLQNLDSHLQKARGELADARRFSSRLQGDKAHLAADKGLASLKRAREQLQDPVTVLEGIAQDELQLLMHTSGLDQLGKGAIQLGPNQSGNPADGNGNGAASQAAPPAPPAWLTSEHLRARQNGLEERTSEVLGRFSAVAEARKSQDSSASDNASNQPDAREQRALDAAIEAIPHLQQAVAAMQAASSALTGGQLGQAVAKENEALLALAAAIERFGGIRDLIEHIYRDHAETLALLTPPEKDPATAKAKATERPNPADLAKLGTEERARRISEAVAKNLDRLARLEGLFDDELAALDAQANQANQANPAQPGAPGQGAVDPKELEAARQQYQRAKELRQQTVDALTRISGAVARPGTGDPLAIASEAMTHVEELRRLFFSIIEHLKELLRNQTETHDSTASASAAPADQLSALLGPLVDAEKGHASMGEALSNALAEQADTAASQNGQNSQAGQAGQAAEQAERMGKAAEEVRAATENMNSASSLMANNMEAATTMSPDFEPTLEAQRKAMERLENAIRLLEPPDPQNDQQEQKQDESQDENQDENQEQKEQKEQQEQQEMSQQQAQRRLQEVRDREAERMRKQSPQKPEPVEKDW